MLDNARYIERVLMVYKPTFTSRLGSRYTIFHVRNGRFGSSQPREPVVQPAVIQHILSHAGHQIGAEGQGVRLGHHGLKKRGRPAGYSAKKLAFIAG